MNGKQIIALISASFGAGTFAQAGTAELQQKLDELKNKPEPRNLQVGAMCYEMVTPAQQNYICPDCGQRTVYPEIDYSKQTGRERNERWNILTTLNLLPSFNRTLATINQTAQKDGYSFTLDTSSFCSECGKGKPKKIRLIVRQPDGTTAPAHPVELDDLRILEAFFAGKDRWKGDQDMEHALQQSLPRIRELLNLPETPQP